MTISAAVELVASVLSCGRVDRRDPHRAANDALLRSLSGWPPVVTSSVDVLSTPTGTASSTRLTGHEIGEFASKPVHFFTLNDHLTGQQP